MINQAALDKATRGFRLRVIKVGTMASDIFFAHDPLEETMDIYDPGLPREILVEYKKLLIADLLGKF